MAGHTPGPWKAIKNRNRGYVVDEAGRSPRHRVAKVCVGETVNDEEINANARLIAAAPDLLAACEAAVGNFDLIQSRLPEHLRGNWQKDSPTAMMRAAIAKAKGGE